MRRKRREIEVFSLSFLDVVSCGFGAIILLLVISKFAAPLARERAAATMTATIAQVERRTTRDAAQARTVARRIRSAEDEQAVLTAKINSLRREIEAARAQLTLVEARKAKLGGEEKGIEEAREKLSAEMERLARSARPRPRDNVVGGIPVDSEYVIFIIDTSGSMQNYAWPLVGRKMKEILEIYPKVKGIQVMNDMGEFMFSQYAGRWIPDSPARRRAILDTLSSWSPFSNSSPVEGITAAIRRFYAADKKISIYVFGDDFARGATLDSVVETVARLNKAGAGGRRRVRIHAIGFPVLLTKSPGAPGIIRFSALMRRLAEDNGGSFVGLNSL